VIWSIGAAIKHLGAITGVLQGDGYRGYPGYAKKNGLALAGCMAHLRRKLLVALKAKAPRAALPVALIQGMYASKSPAS